jgi:hypothetical protein
MSLVDGKVLNVRGRRSRAAVSGALGPRCGVSQKGTKQTGLRGNS